MLSENLQLLISMANCYIRFTIENAINCGALWILQRRKCRLLFTAHQGIEYFFEGMFVVMITTNIYTGCILVY